MEAVKIREWISPNYSDGAGAGAGYGFSAGDGYGRCSSYCYASNASYGYGDGCDDAGGRGIGSGCDDGRGFGDGDGFACGSGFKTYCGKDVFYIDAVPTIINCINGNVAYGAIIAADLSLNKCFVVKQDGKFAHGDTLKNAMSALADKLFEGMPTEERIERFWSEFKLGKKYPAQLFFDWHHRLTGSCEMGRRQFAEDRGIDVETAEYTPEEFIELTENAYNGQIIKRLKEAMSK